ncbi:hypothetical protein OG298_18355 [Streptomyces sp. NBC_01005]|uniref:hypothetical protein n=1 Tax=unclassified Streptomyces TaxID=2593676 RepID=UPI002E338AAC|nr:hypothetical protein [Streptomyces sp. NBC_01362]WSW06183.1 hypothetical protein OG298_18355 [Streptomyces sp. NBC_01005]WTC95687.1 hypothetical protein OH736_18360 [Streptomyces sp. NBC_01650]
MGDYFQTIVDLDATERDAQELGARVLDWLIAEGIVAAERTDCVLGGDGYGHAPGPRFTKAVDDPDPVDLWSNGFHVQTGRTVFDSGQGDAGAAVCPLCRTEIRLVDEVWEPIESAWGPFKGRFQDWAEDGGEGIVRCPSCARPSGIDRWSWEDDYYACGHLGFTFWGWAELTSDFTREIGRRLGGHRTVLLAGKL